jgi:hypothetical protein
MVKSIEQEVNVRRQRRGQTMRIEKDYFALSEILRRWSIGEDDLIYLAENNQIRLSIRVFNQFLEFGDYDTDIDGTRFRVPCEERVFSGLLDLHACDVFHLFRCGEAHLNEFRHDRCTMRLFQKTCTGSMLLLVTF